MFFLDLSAIAKGYGVDRVAEFLGEMGIQNYLRGDWRRAGQQGC